MSRSIWFRIVALIGLQASPWRPAVAGEPNQLQLKPAAEGRKVTSTGYVCPGPNSHMEVTSTELNIFVWTEYIPAEMVECFELVYGVKVNRDEYSSNEEMYAKVSAGGSNYDLVQPTDYIVA